jgi:hydrogenase maturation protein HypF
MTSGNLSEEPVLHEDQGAREKLAQIVDGFLMHDRPIHRRIDDSVYAIVMDEPYPVRRARGYAPNPIRLAEALPEVLAVGPQMKNTFCLTRDKYAFISHHIGEMDNWETFSDYKKAVRDYEDLFRIHPQAVGYDLHPDYVSTTYALERASAEGLPRYAIQHHHAHLAAVMIENGLSPAQNVAGLIFDGTGYGPDGVIWGGEVLIGNCYQVSRFAHLKAVPLPGGDAAIRKPSRMALSTLWAYDLPWEDGLAPVQALTETELLVLENQLEKGINAPLTSSMGRLFDSIAALIGVRQSISYEAQAAIELEALADKNELGYYAWQMDGDRINIKPMLVAILADIKHHETVPVISARFHNTLAQMSLEIAKAVNQQHQIDQIVLSGGVWQNQLLLEKTYQILEENGFHPLIHRQLPPNDGCVAFGQAMVTAYRFMKDKE